MPVIALTSAVILAGVEQLIEWRYGPTGIVGLLLLTVGLKARSPLCSSIGATVLALLICGPAL